jgi:hypothetical protein
MAHISRIVVPRIRLRFRPFKDDISTGRDRAFAKMRAGFLGTEITEKALGDDKYLEVLAVFWLRRRAMQPTPYSALQSMTEAPLTDLCFVYLVSVLVCAITITARGTFRALVPQSRP